MVERVSPQRHSTSLRRSRRSLVGHISASGEVSLQVGLRAVRWSIGCTLAHLVGTVQDLSDRGVGLRVLCGQGARIDTTSAGGRLVFGIFAALAEFERELIRERTVAD